MKTTLSQLLTVVCLTTFPAFGQSTLTRPPIPVILDTDVGDDIDDTWALGLLLKSPELDLKLVVGDYGKANYRARLLAKFLQTAHRTDVPVGVGLDLEPRGEGGQAEWVKGYDLKAYPGKVYDDGVQALIDTILNSPQPITLIAIGPMSNLGAALQREPRIARHARLVGMDGSLRVGYGGSRAPVAEWNVRAAPQACQRAFTAQWDITITPLDTCGLVDLRGERYRRVRDAQDPISAAIIANYRLWSRRHHSDAAETHSSTLFDTVAVYLAIRHDLCQMENLGVRVTDQGMTILDPKAKIVHAATAWKNLDAYRDFLVDRLVSPTP